MNILYTLCTEINDLIKSRYPSVAPLTVACYEMHIIVTTPNPCVGYSV